MERRDGAVRAELKQPPRLDMAGRLVEGLGVKASERIAVMEKRAL